MSIDVQALMDDADRDGIDKVVVGAVVHDHGRVLILRRSPSDGFLPGIEELPSGGVEPGEPLMDALTRELAEEVGWTAPVQVDTGFTASFDYVSGSGRKARQYTFGLAYDGSSITLSNEHTAYRWLHPDKVDHTDLTEESKRTIREWATASR